MLGCGNKALNNSARDSSSTERPITSPIKASNEEAQKLESVVVKGIYSSSAPNLPQGEPNSIAVVAQGTSLSMSGTIPLIVRNNTDQTVIRIKASGTIRDSTGILVASGSDQGFNPNVVRPGEIAIGYVFFGPNDSRPKVWKVEFQTSATPIEKSRFENIRDLDVVEVNKVGKRIVGSLSNPYSEVVIGPIGVKAVCFDSSGSLLSSEMTFAEADVVEPNGKTSFQIDSISATCPSFLLAGSGYTR